MKSKTEEFDLVRKQTFRVITVLKVFSKNLLHSFYQKNMAFWQTWQTWLFTGNFHTVLDETNADMLHL